MKFATMSFSLSSRCPIHGLILRSVLAATAANEMLFVDQPNAFPNLSVFLIYLVAPHHKQRLSLSTTYLCNVNSWSVI